MSVPRPFRVVATVSLALAAGLLGGVSGHLLGVCGPFADVSSPGFCPFVLEIFILGITQGTSPTTYAPDHAVSRLEAAAFLSRTVDRTLARASRRAALGQWWTTRAPNALALTSVGNSPFAVVSDGADLWTTVVGEGVVARVRASDGRLLETWTGATNALAVLAAMGRIFLTTNFSPDVLFMIDPSRPAGSVTPVSGSIGPGPYGLAFDGGRIWVASVLAGVSIVTPGPVMPWSVTTVTAGFQFPFGILFDGNNIWVGDQGAECLFKLDPAGAILQTVTLGGQPGFPAFDGSNIWAPVGVSQVSSVVKVVRARTGEVLATLPTGNLGGAGGAAFDGERVLVADPSTHSVFLWKAADLTPLGSFSTGPFSGPLSVASDGLNFWITLNGTPHLARF